MLFVGNCRGSDRRLFEIVRHFFFFICFFFVNVLLGFRGRATICILLAEIASRRRLHPRRLTALDVEEAFWRRGGGDVNLSRLRLRATIGASSARSPGTRHRSRPEIAKHRSTTWFTMYPVYLNNYDNDLFVSLQFFRRLHTKCDTADSVSRTTQK